VALRLGESQVLPFRFSHYAAQLAQFVDKASKPGDTGEPLTVAVDLVPIEAAVKRIAASASALERRIDGGLSFNRLPSAVTRQLNDVLARLEQRLLDETNQRTSANADPHLRLGYLFPATDNFPHGATARSNDLRRANQSPRASPRPWSTRRGAAGGPACGLGRQPMTGGTTKVRSASTQK
jgi:hypothetical protein